MLSNEALVLSLVLSFALTLDGVDGGAEAPAAPAASTAKPRAASTFSDPVYSTCPEAEPAVTVSWDGGFVTALPPSRAARIACLMEVCDTQRGLAVERARGAGPPPSWLLWGVGIAVTGAVGFAVGYAIKK